MTPGKEKVVEEFWFGLGFGLIAGFWVGRLWEYLFPSDIKEERKT